MLQNKLLELVLFFQMRSKRSYAMQHFFVSTNKVTTIMSNYCDHEISGGIRVLTYQCTHSLIEGSLGLGASGSVIICQHNKRDQAIMFHHVSFIVRHKQSH